jgi:hypothetical protein
MITNILDELAASVFKVSYSLINSKYIHNYIGP